MTLGMLIPDNAFCCLPSCVLRLLPCCDSFHGEVWWPLLQCSTARALARRWVMLNLGMAAKQYETLGRISGSMACVNLFQVPPLSPQSLWHELIVHNLVLLVLFGPHGPLFPAARVHQTVSSPVLMCV